MALRYTLDQGFSSSAEAIWDRVGLCCEGGAVLYIVRGLPASLASPHQVPGETTTTTTSQLYKPKNICRY